MSAPADATAQRLDPEAPFARHVLERTIVLPEARVLFLPIPKTGCTSVLWLLAGLAGIPPERFARSAGAEVSPAMTVHDTALWGAGHRLADYEGDELERVLGADGWLRFSLVRHPATRLWSGWQSKLLAREPRFAERFGDAPWFPRIPARPQEVVEDFRAFVAAVGRGDAPDVHWASQAGLAGRLPLTHVGRAERLADTLAVLREHVGAERLPDPAGRENAGPVPLAPHAYDEPARAVLRAVFEPDYAAFGYAEAVPAATGSPGEWEGRTRLLLPALRTSIAEHARVGQLHRLAQAGEERAAVAERRVALAERQVEELSTRRVGAARSPAITNLEGHTAFNVRWAWAAAERLRPGFTAVLRVKDEARNLPWVLPPLLAAVERVVLVDNGSSDGTPGVARRLAEDAGAGDRLDCVEYPFAIARCGAEHLATPAASVHSLVHFYNWAFSHVETAYALKWDGDMVLTDQAAASLRDLAWQLEAADVVVKVPRSPLYLSGDRRAFLDTGLRNTEPWGWPNGPGYSFAKAIDWELPLWRAGQRAITLPDWGCVELKRLDADEFAHWSHSDFAASARTARKLREWEVFHALRDGAPPPAGVLEIEAPPGVHVVEHVRTAWLPARASAAGA